MPQDSILLERSLRFAARIVKLHRYLTKEKHEAMISKQIIRSASSIGANANEAIYLLGRTSVREPHAETADSFLLAAAQKAPLAGAFFR